MSAATSTIQIAAFRFPFSVETRLCALSGIRIGLFIAVLSGYQISRWVRLLSHGKMFGVVQQWNYMEIQRLLEWFFAIVGAWAFCDIFAGMEINYPGEERQFRFLRKYLDTKYDILIFILCIVLWAALKNNS